MITKILNGIVTIEPWGFSANKYSLEEFTAKDLLIERQILAAYRMAHPVSCDLFLELDEQIAKAIDDKFDKNGKELRESHGKI